MQVLIAEDDRVTGEILARTLNRWNYDTTVVSDGTLAWEYLRAATAPTLAILDWMMPGMDGPDVCRRVRADLPLANMYLLLVTARETRGDVIAGLDAGADDYIIKPFDPDELRARVAVGVGNRQRDVAWMPVQDSRQKLPALARIAGADRRELRHRDQQQPGAIEHARLLIRRQPHQPQAVPNRLFAAALPGQRLRHEDRSDRRRRSNQRDEQQTAAQARAEGVHFSVVAGGTAGGSNSSTTLSKQVGQMPCENCASVCSVM